MSNTTWLSGKRKPLNRGGGLIAINQIEELDPHGLSTSNKRERASSVASEDIDLESHHSHESEHDEDVVQLDVRPGEIAPPPATESEKRRKAEILYAKHNQGRPPKKSKTAQEKQKEKDPPDFIATLPWPDHFVKLEKTFKALNTVYTFCTARKHLAPTYANMKKSVEGLLRRTLEIQEIAQMKALLPELVRFAYIAPELLKIHMEGAEQKPQSGKFGKKDKDNAENESFELPDMSRVDPDEQVLIFEFTDGEVKAEKGGGKFNSRRRKNKDGTHKEIIINAVYTPEAMTRMIEKRNVKFHSAVDELLVACNAQDLDPVSLLLTATEDHVPVKSSEIEGADKIVPLRERRADLDFYLRNPDNRPSIESVIAELKDEDFYKDQIVDGGHRIFSAREAKFGNVELSQGIMDALYATKGITSMYSHQAEAINHLINGSHVIVSTSTSSGKSLIYQVPALAAFERDIEATAMYIFPTKALAQDQKRALADLLSYCEHLSEVKIATFDGDTPKDDRNFIRDRANVIFTNPDMLHITVLPHEEEWRRFFENLKLVVVDELHMYNGLFGCHVAFIMRRLRRVCAAVGNHRVMFVSCSATVSNPAEHMEAIFGITGVKVVDVDGSPTGRKEYLVWNPPFIDPHQITQGRVSTIAETSRIVRFLMDRGIRVIVFCKVRKICEVVIKQIRTDLAIEGRSDMASRVRSYRSGYTAADRREIEAEMFNGHLLAIIATTALELGIDIGSLDAVVTVGFPYTLPGFRQQAGRAGRRNKDSLAMLVTDPWPLDQHYARNPDELFSKPDAQLSVDLENPIVLEGHLQCAAQEMPVKPEDDEVYFGAMMKEICKERLLPDEEGYYHAHPRMLPFPSRHVSIRNTEDETYVIVDTTNGRQKILEEIEWSRAVFEVFEGALFIHQGKTFITLEVNHTTRIAKLVQAQVDWMTKQRDYTDVDAVEAVRVREIKGSVNRAYYGPVRVTSVVYGYFKVDKRNNILDVVDLDTPPFVRDTNGVWVDVPRSCLEILTEKNLHIAGAIHAAEHALMGLTPLFVMSVAGDIRTECKVPEKEFLNKASKRKRPARLTIYDASGKSGGVCAKVFDHINRLLAMAADTIVNCKCIEGCPSCVASASCSQGNIVVSKLGALICLQSILGRHIDVDSIPVFPPMPQSMAETIEAQGPVKLSSTAVILTANGTPKPREELRQAQGFFDLDENDTPDLLAGRGGFLQD
ncbi:uncharacterized protein L969DRAFT_76721 [Mixia osmundae IAM 14324]|uniref:Uncharacterized protein n=1 Tax=Mixia osmundae (strain CBS 9802 / IAM 14324 / JCM 22182 / KY 12970) TaxID=764103 RepID=G7E7U7_MIXOS|nr:uncharacterized protein L969DRAFT_76721 [Mixia osmundae IAM 14324]KEI38508.1 hypothetical protein L969DRAFT_76721 [Mixia osmundae IAM 14324]GAA98907.1 hypothetical protein E5Q_05595 [Mixia osmundae IAM 14324]